MANETNTLPIDDEQTQQTAEQPRQETSLSKSVKYTPELCAATINKLPAQLQALKGCFAQPFDAFRKAFKDPAEADRVMAKEIDFAAQAMLANNYLITCAQQNPLDLVNALKNVALTGSTLNPTLKLGYLVPFKGKITFMPSYMGLVDLLANNGLVRKVEAHPVFEGEDFEIKLGTKNYLRHLPNPWGKRDKENLLGCYYYVVLTDGTEMFDTMSKAEIDAVMQRSPSVGKGKTSPWDTDYIEMAKKCLVRRAFKMIPKGGISEDKVKALEAVFDYDEKTEQSWIAEQKPSPKGNPFDEEETEYEEIN